MFKGKNVIEFILEKHSIASVFIHIQIYHISVICTASGWKYICRRSVNSLSLVSRWAGVNPEPEPEWVLTWPGPGSSQLWSGLAITSHHNISDNISEWLSGVNWSADHIKIVRGAPSRDVDNIFWVFVLTSKGHVKYDAARELVRSGRHMWCPPLPPDTASDTWHLTVIPITSPEPRAVTAHF